MAGGGLAPDHAGTSEASTVAAGEPTHPEAHVVVLSHAFWKRRFGARRDVLGRSLLLDGEAVEVVGVAPPGRGEVVQSLD